MRVYGMIQHYRSKQKALALQYLKNDGLKLSNEGIFHSVPTFALSYLLLINKIVINHKKSFPHMPR